jgi:anti-sigma B factor antagonist
VTGPPRDVPWVPGLPGGHVVSLRAPLAGPRGIAGEENPAAAAEQAPALTVRDQWDDGTVTVTVRGEIDAATADTFYQRLADVASGSPRRLVIDLAGVDFLDSSGPRAFVRLRKALPGHCLVILRSAHLRTRQVFELTGLGTAFEFD